MLSKRRNLVVPLLDVVKPDKQGAKDRKFVTALSRGLEILRAFGPSDTALGNQEIASRTGLPKPTVSRLTYTLTKLGYLSYSERLEKYRLGLGVLALGYSFVSSMGIREIVLPLMQQLADRTNASIALGSRDRLNMVYLENCRSSAAVTLRLDVGSRIPIATTAMGRAFLAVLPDKERDFLLDHIRKNEKDRWPKIRTQIEKSMREYEEKGYVVSAGDWDSTVNAVGVPLVRAEHADIMAFNCGGPSFLLPREKLDTELGPLLLEMVNKVQRALNPR